jgi:hypothetical protein
MRHPLIRLPLTALLLWLAWLAGSQAIDAFTSGDDWSDGYVRGTATVVGSRAEYSSSSGSRGAYSCQLIVEPRSSS